MLPAALFIGANVLKFGLGIEGPYDVLRPLTDPPKATTNLVTVLVLAGPVVGLAIALWPIIRLRFGHPDRLIQATVSLRLQWVNIAIAVVALGLLAILFGHILAENAACWFGSDAFC